MYHGPRLETIEGIGEEYMAVDNHSLLAGMFQHVQPTTRRSFIKRLGLITVAVPGVGSLLAACGGDDATPTPRPTNTPASIPTTVVGGQASPTPAPADATPTSGAAATSAPGATATPAPQADPTATPATGGPVQGGTLVVQGHHEIASLHPDDAGPTVHWVIVANIHDSLIEVDKDFMIAPILATSFEAAADGLSFTFSLNEGVMFHDGEEFTSEDVKYTFEYYANPDNTTVLGPTFSEIDRVETPDDYTAVIHLKTVDAAILVLGMTEFILPEHHHSVVGKDGYASDPIGTGPFKLLEWRPAEQTTLEAYDDYFRGRPNLDFFREEIVPEASVRTIALERGDSDHAVWPLVAEDHLRLMADDRFLVLRAPSAAINHFPLNNDHPPLSEIAVRQAMMWAVDRDRLINDLEQGLAVLATSNLSPALVYYYETDVVQYSHDPDRARQILDDAGWAVGSDGIRAKDGVRLEFVCTVITGDQRRKPEAEIVQQDLLAVGIDMSIEEAPVATIIEQLTQPGVQMQSSLFNWTYGGDSGEPDARGTLRSDGARNYSHYRNPRVDELLDAGVATTEPEERRAAYAEIQQIVAEEVPFLFIMFWEWIQIFNTRVKGVPESSPNTNGPYRLVHTYWIDES
ncbi:MAG TPA: ABC transporter substrate-binding protein [Thermomicrobiales bacterium]|nr:ABC transporter substrate-binding protein [Thermomicrobiales bacterium]